jgi:hypothetical protein
LFYKFLFDKELIVRDFVECNQTKIFWSMSTVGINWGFQFCELLICWTWISRSSVSPDSICVSQLTDLCRNIEVKAYFVKLFVYLETSEYQWFNALCRNGKENVDAKSCLNQPRINFDSSVRLWVSPLLGVFLIFQA